ncbi:hypothetical protein ATS72_017455 [Pseudoalteromonas sp. 13-15]|uniref:hypothetical protein n=1 Tax=Pseudoalteromonas TaxID=53246 RepID=UPI00073115B2|nr:MULTISPECIES: hypothetical protein [Pseudoalteromonas]AUL75411.1 hypothetical protein ATS72_017455 [Pseudoalteromonas sp. 13-15]WFO20791.1 hypothetical protein ATS73_018790 [Pseudoalteromonas sp. H100]SIO24207.1 hypothetical protein SAMN05878071_3506 [Pseudoalteromonas marina]
MKYKLYISIVLLATFLSGCGATFKAVHAGKSPMQIVANKRVFEFTKVKQEGASSITEFDIAYAIKTQISGKAPYSNCGSLCTRRINPGAPLEKWGRTVSLNTSNKTIRLTLVNGELFSTGDFHSTKLYADFKYEISETPEKLIFTLFPASEVETVPGKNPIFMTYTPLMEGQKLEQRLVKLFSDINPSIKKKVTRSGEFNVDFDPASVKTNFTRLLDGWGRNESESTSKNKYESSFKLSIGKTTAKVDVNIFLYRGNSKVEYSISYPYIISGNGTSSVKEPAIMDKLIEHVRKVANS